MVIPSARRLIILGILAWMAAGCKSQSPGETPEPKPGGGKIGVMQFRPVPDSSGLLGPKSEDTLGGYSFRPPAGWTRMESGNAGSKNAVKLAARMRFGDADSGDFVDVAILVKPPAVISEDRLIGSKNAIENALRAARGKDLLGVDLFKFGEGYAIQTMVRNGASVVLQLMIFTNDGKGAQITFSLGARRYRSLARAVEGSIASFTWTR